MKEKQFEDAMKELEDIVKRLESGDLSLEESLKIFEEGIALSRYCFKKLEEAEKRVSILIKDEEGIKREPFASEEIEGVEKD
ncbi:MAG: exodeoxyribonuclease VII small subunit [Deltaproteobacteria bacterium]|jgi:exodeoxyribonuclease VII small subunit|nr:MAG: exodeoxyribonuclease VII small subunit [Desulfobacteraceae bacterium]UCG64228.1 MAG: exodeoxyribonuclease VII small subunit [Deltaproteobacteria bacterium]